MLRIGLIDVDGHNFPNLALMKVSAYHKAQGDRVEWCNPLEIIPYDMVYQSKVFDETYSTDIDWTPCAKLIVKGGTGYVRRHKDKITYKTWLEYYVDGKWIHEDKYHGTDKYAEFLPDEVEHTYPDYELYPKLTKDTAYGHLTRGCPRNCSFCCVSCKEGQRAVKVADLSEFWRGQKNIVLLDANLLACARDHMDLLRQLRESGSYIDFNQGLDIRLLHNGAIDIINDIKLRNIHFAWDNPRDCLEYDFRKYAQRAKHKPHGSYGTVYVLVNYNSALSEDLYRIYTLRDLGYLPYVMVYDKPNSPKIMRDLQRWCNKREIFKSCPNFGEYNKNKGVQT